MITPSKLDNIFPPTWDGTKPYQPGDEHVDPLSALRWTRGQDWYNYFTQQRLEGDLFKRDLMKEADLQALIDFLATRPPLTFNGATVFVGASDSVSLGRVNFPRADNQATAVAADRMFIKQAWAAYASVVLVEVGSGSPALSNFTLQVQPQEIVGTGFSDVGSAALSVNASLANPATNAELLNRWTVNTIGVPSSLPSARPIALPSTAAVASEALGSTNGSGTLAATIAHIPIAPATVFVTIGAQVYHDDGSGGMLDASNANHGSVNYTTGALSITGAPNSTAATGAYQYALFYDVRLVNAHATIDALLSGVCALVPSRV